MGEGKLKACLFYNKLENFFMRDIVLFVIDFAIISSNKNKVFFRHILTIFDNFWGAEDIYISKQS